MLVFIPTTITCIFLLCYLVRLNIVQTHLKHSELGYHFIYLMLCELLSRVITLDMDYKSPVLSSFFFFLIKRRDVYVERKRNACHLMVFSGALPLHLTIFIAVSCWVVLLAAHTLSFCLCGNIFLKFGFISSEISLRKFI